MKCHRVRFRPLRRARIRTLYENEKPPRPRHWPGPDGRECRREASLCSSSRPRRLRCERVPCSDAPDSIPPLPEGDHTRLDACGTGIHMLARARKRLPRPPRPLFLLLPGQIARILTGIWLTRWIIAGSRLLCRLTAIWVGRPSYHFHVSHSPSLPFSHFPSASLMPGQFFPPPRFSDYHRLTLPHAAHPGSVASILPNPAVTSKIFGTVPITEGEWDHHPFPLHGCRGSRGSREMQKEADGDGHCDIERVGARGRDGVCVHVLMYSCASNFLC